MPTLRINKHLKDQTYFLTCTVRYWIDIFTSIDYYDLIINTLKFYQAKQHLQLYGYVIMTNHIHLIAQSPNMISFLKHFKSYTTKELKRLLKIDNRKYILDLLRIPSSQRGSQKLQIWQSKNWPVLIEENDFFQQKLDYIHENPVVKGYVTHEENWIYSSARNYILDDHSIIEVVTG